MIDIKNIVTGWKNVIIEDSEIEKIAAFRLSICGDCEYKINQLGLDVCGKCHCPLIAKTRSNDVCPAGKW